MTSTSRATWPSPSPSSNAGRRSRALPQRRRRAHFVAAYADLAVWRDAQPHQRVSAVPFVDGPGVRRAQRVDPMWRTCRCPTARCSPSTCSASRDCRCRRTRRASGSTSCSPASSLPSVAPDGGVLRRLDGRQLCRPHARAGRIADPAGPGDDVRADPGRDRCWRWSPMRQRDARRGARRRAALNLLRRATVALGPTSSHAIHGERPAAISERRAVRTRVYRYCRSSPARTACTMSVRALTDVALARCCHRQVAEFARTRRYTQVLGGFHGRASVRARVRMRSTASATDRAGRTPGESIVDHRHGKVVRETGAGPHKKCSRIEELEASGCASARSAKHNVRPRSR